MLVRLTLTLAAAALLPMAGLAGSLDPEQVSADAKWLVHVDVAALEQTEALQEVRDVWPDKTQKFRNWMQDRYGIDPREDFDSVTLYGTGYENSDCVAVLTADYSEDKVRSRITSQEDVEKTEWRDHTIYTCDVGKKMSAAHDRDHGSRKGDKRGQRVAWTLVDDNTVIYAKSKRSLKDAVETIEGHAPSLAGKDSQLTADLPEGAVAYAAAVDLDSIPHEGMMFPILRQHDHACYAIGERDGKLFDELKLVARNEQVAKEMKQVVEGYAAALKIGFSNSDPVSKMLDNVDIQQEGDTVKASWNGQVERFAQALEDYKKRR